MLSKRVKKALDAASHAVGMGEEAAHHYGCRYTRLDQADSWFRGLAAGWAGDYDLGVPVSARMKRLFRGRLSVR